ncbi:MAG: class I SAM-dependent methyltransferase [Alphaproteobacteria bacterium]
MYNSIQELETFYDSEIGKVVQSILARRVEKLWPDLHDYRVLGCGYSVPYLAPYLGKAERVIAMMPERQGVRAWPKNSKNLVMTCRESRMPIENVSIDRALLVHHLECCDHLKDSLREIWRVLKPNGRVLIIVPNRVGFWARADLLPFGRGHPFTMAQALFCLRDNLLVPEHYESALFVPPLPDSPVMMRFANVIERIGHKVFPFVAGVHIIECSKQVYAKIDNTGSGSAVFEKTKGILAGKPVPTSLKSYRIKTGHQVDYLD